MTLTTKTAKGAKLTPTEIDANWTEIDGRLTALETNPPEAVSIASMSVTDGNKLRITLTDNSILGPFTLPSTNFTYKAGWMPNTGYLPNDVFSYASSLYIVLYPHTSGATFDPGAGDGQGQHYYSLIMTVPYAGSWQGELDYGITYRVGDTFKLTTAGAVSLYGVNIEHETVSPFNAARQIGGNSVYTLQFTAAIPSAAPEYLSFTDRKDSLDTIPAETVISRWIVTEDCTWNEDFTGSRCICYAGTSDVYLDVRWNTLKIGIIYIPANEHVGQFMQDVVPAVISAGDTVCVKTQDGATAGVGEYVIALRLPRA